MIIEHPTLQLLTARFPFRGLRIASPESTVKLVTMLKLSEVQLKVVWMHSLAQPGRISLQRADSSSEPARSGILAAGPLAPQTRISVATIALYLRKDAEEAVARRDRGAGPHTVAVALRHRGLLPRLTGGRVVFRPQPPIASSRRSTP